MPRLMTDQMVNKLKGEIVAGGYTISSLADSLEISRNTLSAKVNGKVDFTRQDMERIAQRLGKPPETIFFAPEFR